jgi:hypothetical protein
MTQTIITTREGTTTALSEETMAAFGERLRGQLLFPADASFEDAELSEVKARSEDLADLDDMSTAEAFFEAEDSEIRRTIETI